MTQAPLVLRTPAKINPVLEVLSQRPDGYHELALVFQAVDLFDEIAFEPHPEKVELTVLDAPGSLDPGESNLAVKAARLFIRETLGGRGGVRMRLRKRIPLAAGLGGGSSDAAAVLMGMDWLYQTRLVPGRLAELASMLGSDVPFFLEGGAALGEGRGEKITKWVPGPERALLLATPSDGLSTPAVYRSGKARWTDGSRARNFQSVLKDPDPRAFGAGLFNGLAPAAYFLRPDVQELENKMRESGAIGALVSGSGPTIFGVMEGRKEAEAAATRLARPGLILSVVRTCADGAQRT